MRINGLIVAALSGLLAIPGQAQHWQTPAKWHRTLKKAVPGTVSLDDDGVEFRSAKFNQRWPYVEVRSFDLSGHDFTLLSYERRPWREPGERPFHFTLSEAMPPEIAAQFTARVAKPVRNGNPLPSAASIAEVPAHRRTWSGGSNGMLRFKQDGIDYVTQNGRDSRSWRWADIETLANPNPYEFRISAFREIVEFDLKQPLSRALFERMWDRLYATDLNLTFASSEVF